MTRSHASLISVTLIALCATACGKADPATSTITPATMMPPISQAIRTGDKVRLICENWIDPNSPPATIQRGELPEVPGTGSLNCSVHIVEAAPTPDAGTPDSAPVDAQTPDSSSPDAGTPDANVTADTAISADTTVAADAMTDAIVLPAPITPDISTCPTPSNLAPTTQMMRDLGNGCTAFSTAFFPINQPQPVRTNGLASTYVWGTGSLGLQWFGGRPTLATEKIANGWVVTKLNLPANGTTSQGRLAMSATQTPNMPGATSWWMPSSCAVATMSTVGKSELNCGWYSAGSMTCGGAGDCNIDVTYTGFTPSFSTNMNNFGGCPGEVCP